MYGNIWGGMLNLNCCENGVVIGKFIFLGEKLVFVWLGVGVCCDYLFFWNFGEENFVVCELGNVLFWLFFFEIK